MATAQFEKVWKYISIDLTYSISVGHWQLINAGVFTVAIRLEYTMMFNDAYWSLLLFGD